jgi:hypothetical protein
MYDHYTMEDEVELVERLKFPELNKYLDEPLTMPMKRKPTAIPKKPQFTATTLPKMHNERPTALNSHSWMLIYHH